VALCATRRLPEEAPKVLAGYVINVALPAAALRNVHDVSVDAQWLLAAASPWIGVGRAYPFVPALGLVAPPGGAHSYWWPAAATPRLGDTLLEEVCDDRQEVERRLASTLTLVVCCRVDPLCAARWVSNAHAPFVGHVPL